MTRASQRKSPNHANVVAIDTVVVRCNGFSSERDFARLCDQRINWLCG